MQEVCSLLVPAVSAREVRWAEIGTNGNSSADVSPAGIWVKSRTEPSLLLSQGETLTPDSHTPGDNYVTLLEGSGSHGAFVFVPTAEPPYYKFEIGILAGGRRLLSDDIAMLGAVAVMVDIERARFEERLRVTIDVPEELLSVRVPSLLIQPLVENAIKHGITPSRFGGEVRIRARREKASDDVNLPGDVLDITVSDTGMGASEIELARGRRRGVGLTNIEERLRCYGEQAASLRIHSTLGEGTIVELRLPLSEPVSETSAVSVQQIREMRR